MIQKTDRDLEEDEYEMDYNKHTRTIIVYKNPSKAGLVSGIFGCIFAVLAIFTIGIIFLPFAVLFSVVSVSSSLIGLSATGFCVSIASIILTVIGFVTSPSAWLALVGLLAMPSAHHASETTIETSIRTPNQTEQVIAQPALPSTFPTVVPAPTVSSQPDPYADGLADRTAFENWRASLEPDEKAGADYWASQRSERHPGPCVRSDGNSAWVVGCRESQRRLAPTDARRLSEPKYRQGWNAF